MKNNRANTYPSNVAKVENLLAGSHGAGKTKMIHGMRKESISSKAGSTPTACRRALSVQVLDA